MPLVAADFKRPTGRLSPDWFVDDLDASLTAWLAEAVTKTSDEAIQAAWVYHRAYQTLADDRSLVAATTAADDIRESFSDSQVAHWQKLADSMRAQYERLAGLGGPYFTPICT